MSVTIHKNFLKAGDPALTYPYGKTYSPLHPKGVPRGPECSDTQYERERMVREWESRLSVKPAKIRQASGANRWPPTQPILPLSGKTQCHTPS
ncbi:hypothetical protein [Altererythrobacter aquiaggeris]|uniref:hypothetical protein n=1 Tax=Aestuarierythrobacter aquiaggeris TaxID=1898396 RepID=UPI00301AA060